MGTPSVNRSLSDEQQVTAAARYAAGERLETLCAEYRVWTARIRFAISKARVPLRPEDLQPRLCRVCGEVVPSSTRRGLCGAHVRCFCSRCEDPLPKGRINRWCSACEAAKKEALWSRSGRPCTTCGGLVTGHASECARCLHEKYELECALRERSARSCRQCRATMPKGRRVPWCTGCYRKRERQRRKDCLARGEHRCVQCGEVLPLKRASYCAGCGEMLQNWRRVWHAGNPVARRLGTVEKRRQRQESGGRAAG